MLYIKYSNKDLDEIDVAGYTVKVDGNIETVEELKDILIPLLGYLGFTLDELLQEETVEEQKSLRAEKEKYTNV